MPDFDEKNRLGDLYPTSYCGPREIMMALNEDGKSLKPEQILMTTGSDFKKKSPSSLNWELGNCGGARGVVCSLKGVTL